jgi:hypothetical protein
MVPGVSRVLLPKSYCLGPHKCRRDEELVMLSATVKEAVADVQSETPQEDSREAAPGPP